MKPLTALFSGNLEFLHAQWLWLLPVLLAISLLLWKQSRHRNEMQGEAADLINPGYTSRIRFLHPLLTRLATVHSKPESRKVNQIIPIAILACLVLALSEPVLRGEKLPDPPRERDIVFIVDTSVSMILRDYLLEDQRIERMSLLKGLLDRFVLKLKGERMGVIVFGEHAYTLVPLTSDQHLIQTMLRRIKTTMAGRYNAIGDAITLAVSQAGNQPERKRVLILLTAANQPTGKITPMQAADYAKQSGIPLYTVAIGATDYTAQDVRDSGLIYRPVNVELLQSLAAHTGAQYYLAKDTQSLERAINAIEQRESNLGQPPPIYTHQPLYQWPLFIGLLLLCILQTINYLRHWQESTQV